MNLFRAIFCATVLAGLSIAPAVARPACANPEQVKAVQLRQLHDELQVAALNCRGALPEMPAKWEYYVRQHGATLAENARVLRGYFKSAAALDRHNTVVTNRLSAQVHETPGYCDLHVAMFDKVTALTPPQLLVFAAETEGDPMEIHACPPHKAAGGKAGKAAK